MNDNFPHILAYILTPSKYKHSLLPSNSFEGNSMWLQLKTSERLCLAHYFNRFSLLSFSCCCNRKRHILSRVHFCCFLLRCKCGAAEDYLSNTMLNWLLHSWNNLPCHVETSEHHPLFVNSNEGDLGSSFNPRILSW